MRTLLISILLIAPAGAQALVAQYQAGSAGAPPYGSRPSEPGLDLDGSFEWSRGADRSFTRWQHGSKRLGG